MAMGPSLAVALWALGAAPERLPMPEPLLGETLTDIDSDEAGELELEGTGLVLLRGEEDAPEWSSSLEVEWRATERLGLALEVEAGGEGLAAPHAFGLQASASWILLHDSAHDLHLQAELHVRALSVGGEARELDPGEPTLPLAFGLRAGWRRGPWTLRAGLGGEALGPSAHLVPLRAGLAGFVGLGNLGFAGVELDGDWARVAPLLLAPTAVLRLHAVGVPFAVGVAVPWLPPQAGMLGTLGVFARLFYELDGDW